MSLLAGLTLFSRVAVAGVELQQSSQDEPDDTLLSHAYDAENHLLLFNSTETDIAYDCSLPAGLLTTGYGMFDDGVAVVDGITLDDGVPVEFQPRPADELGEGVTPAADPLAYDGEPDNPCTLGAHLVAGPHGQVNHGQVVRTFGHALEGGHKGCLMRWIAQSPYGKGDQQIRTPDADPGFTPGASGKVEFTNVLTTCNHGNSNTAGSHGNSNTAGSHGRGHGGSPGKSGEAPGHNK